MRKFLLVIAFLFVVVPVKANDIYIAQIAAGAGNGTDCADARDLAWFNNSGNWGTGSSQIGPGTTVHLCGTFNAPAGSNNYMSTQGSGSSGNPITIKFEANAILQAPYWGAVIYIGNSSYITIDGGTNGIIRATDNGTLLGNHHDGGIAVYSPLGGSNLTVKNLTVENLYVHSCTPPVSSCTDEMGGNTNGILLGGGNNQLITHNTIHDVKWAISYSMAGASASNVTISNNTAYNADHGIFTTDGNNANGAVMNGLYIYGNTWHDAANWDDAANNFHHDCTHNDLSHSGTSAVNVFIYNNYCYGNWGQHMNAAVYLSSAYGSYVATVFNNVLVAGPGSGLGCGMICSLSGVSASVFNNTIIGTGPAFGVAMHFYGPSSIFENNVVESVYEAISRSDPGVLQTVDYNTYYNVGSGGWSQVSFSGWQGYGWDVHGSYSNPNLSSSNVPTSSSTALIKKGANLGGLSITQLNVDKAGNARPILPTNWDIGAYQYGSGGTSSSVAPPANLVASVQ